MIYAKPTEYAIRGISELAGRGATGMVLLDNLVEGTDLPRDFMAKIFQQLVKAQILRSSKGRRGGFALARPAHDISLLQIVEAMEGPYTLERCVVGFETCSDATPCAQHDLCKPIRQKMKEYLSNTTVADLGSSLRAKQAWRELHIENAQAAGEAI